MSLLLAKNGGKMSAAVVTLKHFQKFPQNETSQSWQWKPEYLDRTTLSLQAVCALSHMTHII